MNGQTDYDYTNFVFDMPADSVGIALQIEANRMRGLALRPSDWNIEKRAVLNEIDGDESSPFFNLLSRVRAAAYPRSARGPHANRHRADVANSRPSPTSRAYYHEWYAPNNATLVVAGDVDHRAIFALAQRDFGGMAARKLPPA